VQLVGDGRNAGGDKRDKLHFYTGIVHKHPEPVLQSFASLKLSSLAGRSVYVNVPWRYRRPGESAFACCDRAEQQILGAATTTSQLSAARRKTVV